MASADLKGAYRDRQAWMENLIADRTLSRGELAVAMCLAFHKNLTSGQCNPSLDRIAKHTGIKVRGAQHALSSLESRGWIKRQIGGRGPRSTTQYDLLRVQYLAPLDQPPRVQENDVRVQANADEGATVESVGCSKVHPNLKNINLNHDGTVCADPPHSPLIENLNGSEERLPTDSEIDAGFEVFWRQHPRAVHQGKARTEYRKAIPIYLGGWKSVPSEELREVGTGELVLTNRRLLFLGAHTLALPFDGLLTCQQMDAALLVSESRSKRPHALILENAGLWCFLVNWAADSRFKDPKLPDDMHLSVSGKTPELEVQLLRRNIRLEPDSAPPTTAWLERYKPSKWT